MVWYSPSIFLGIVSGFVLKRCRSVGYLVLRDVFPQWAHEFGVIRRGPAYFFLRLIAEYQYRAAHVIGVQSRGNLRYFSGT